MTVPPPDNDPIRVIQLECPASHRRQSSHHFDVAMELAAVKASVPASITVRTLIRVHTREGHRSTVDVDASPVPDRIFRRKSAGRCHLLERHVAIVFQNVSLSNWSWSPPGSAPTGFTVVPPV